MSKLIALYKQPEDPQSFDDAYFNTHLPLINQVPGLVSTVITRFSRTLVGDGFYMMAEMDFGTMDNLKTAMRSPEMAAAGDILNSFAEGLYILMFGNDQS